MTLRTLRVPVALAAVLAVLVAGQMPTSAHGKFIYHGDGEFKDFAGISSDHENGVAFDGERDGHYVCAEWRDEFDLYKECDGGDSGGDYIGPFDFPVEEFRLCEENKGCTDWHST